MSSAIVRIATSVRRLEANGEEEDPSAVGLVPAIRFHGSVDPVKFFAPRKFGFYPVFRGDLLAFRIQHNDFVFLCEKENTAYCKEQHLDFISFSVAKILHAVQYKERRVRLWKDKKEFLNKMATLQPGGIVHIRMPEVSPIPVEAILRCRVTIKTSQCDCENMLFGVELKEYRNCGDSDGTILGQRLFTCERNCGMYVSIEQLVDLCIDDSLYRMVLNEKSAATTLIKMTFVGAEGAGKTSLIRTLLGKPFQSNEASTIGAYFTKAISLFISSSYANSDSNLKYCRFHSIEWKEVEIPEVNSLIHNQFIGKVSESVERHKELSISDNNDTNSVNVESLGERNSLGSFTELQANDGVDDDRIFTDEERLCDLEVTISSKDLREATYSTKMANHIRFVLSDYGGHLIFHNFHLLFTSEDDVIAITIDASHDLDSPVIPRERCDYTKEKRTAAGMLTPLQTIHLWLQSIHARATTKPENASNIALSRIYPTVLIVATHVWWLFRRQQFIDKIRATLIDKPYAQHLPENDEAAFHFINSKHRWWYKNAIVKLKNVLLLSARYLFQEKRPVCYLKFEEAVLRAVEENVEKLTVLETLEIAVSCGITDKRDSDDKDFLEALTHFTKKGVLLYYPEIPALRDTVFISPQWLVDVFSSIITTHNLVKEGDPFRQAWLRYDQFGILEEDFLNHILKKNNNFENKNVILGLFEKFNLAIKIPSGTRFTGNAYQVNETGSTYLVPSLLLDNPSYRETFEVDCNKAGHDLMSLVFYFPDGFLPETTVNQLLVKCIQWNFERGYKLERILYAYGHFRLGGNQFYILKTMQLSEDRFKSAIHLDILFIEPVVSFDEQSQNLRLELLEYLTQSLDDITNVSMPMATKPVVHLVCPHCSGAKIVEPHLPLSDIIPDGPLVCSRTAKVVHEEHYCCLLKNLQNTQPKRSTRLQAHVHQPVGNQFSVNSVEHFVEVSHEQDVTHQTADDHTTLTSASDVKLRIPNNHLLTHTSPLTNSRSYSILEQKVTMAVIPLIAPSLAVHWENIGYRLGVGDENSSWEIDTIKKTYANPTECFNAVIQKWISGCSGKSPKIWGTFENILTSLNINFSQNVEPKLVEYSRRKINHQLQGVVAGVSYIGNLVTMRTVPLLSKQLAPHWISIGYLLDLDDYGSTVQWIRSTHAKPEDCFSHTVKEWINGSKGVEPKTWQTFIQLLEDLKLNVNEINNIIFSEDNCV